MNPPRAAALTLRIVDDRDGGYTITASVPGRVDPWVNRTPRSSLDEARLEYAEKLGFFKHHIGRDLEPTNWDGLGRALGVLRIVSGRLIDALAPRNSSSFRKFIKEALEPLRDAPYAPVVEVHAPSELLFPFELVQVPDNDWPRAINDGETLLRACRTFLGFSVAIRRVFTDLAEDEEGLDQNRILRNRRRLALTLFQDASLKGARAEAAFFSRNKDLFNLRVWPQQSSTSIPAGLAAQLFDSRVGLDGAEGRLLPDEIQHFACHCTSPDDDRPLRNALSLGAQGAKSYVVTLGELGAEFGLIEAPDDPPRPGPLVFLNACASAAMSAKFNTSFVRWFLRHQNRGVIGTETMIPDTFAAVFAAQFYRAFLAKEPIGQALLSAKRYMVQRYNNPLGMVYTMYADPDLQVEVKVDKGLIHE
jgi:hypothetical protein